MAARRLTTTFYDSVNVVAARQISYPDHDVRGLELRVSGDGRKVWNFRCTTKLARRGRITLGLRSREFGLYEARTAARRAQVAVDQGGDPAMELRQSKIEASTEHLRTFGDLAAARFADTDAHVASAGGPEPVSPTHNGKTRRRPQMGNGLPFHGP